MFMGNNNKYEFEKTLKEIKKQPIFLTPLLLGGVICVFSIIFRGEYFLYGYLMILYSVIAVLIRFFYQDVIKIYPDKKWFTVVYNIIQILVVAIWIWKSLQINLL